MLLKLLVYKNYSNGKGHDMTQQMEAAKVLTAEEQREQDKKIERATLGLADILADILTQPDTLKATA